MKTIFLFKINVFLLLLVHSVQSQILEPKQAVSKLAYAEKIYLQLSSTVFTSDQTVWFKAVVTDTNNLPTNLSGILHVELIDFDERLIEHKLLKLENGIADGFFQLQESMPLGRYLIRAYTEWNKNFNADFISKQYIDIYSAEEIETDKDAFKQIVLTQTETKQFEISGKAYPRLLNPKYRGKLMLYFEMPNKKDSLEITKDKSGFYAFKYVLPPNVARVGLAFQPDSLKLKNHNLEFLNTYRKTIAVDTSFLDLQFFPEGGKLVDGLVSKVAFKALDYKNESKAISGNIIDENDSVITSFKTNSLGMGIVSLKADSKKTYYADVNTKSAPKFRVELPKVYNKGLVLTVSQQKVALYATVRSNYLEQDSLFLKIYSRGVLYHDLKLKLKDSTAAALINKKVLPHGIVKFILFDKNHQPVSERLVFNHNKDDLFSIEGKHLKTYSQRDKTVIDLAIKDIDTSAVKANLSVLVLNKEHMENANIDKQNILSYFLLSSELKGSVENPAHYFNTENQSRFADLDALLLTQGWSNYIYENIETEKQFKIKPEQNLSISGTVGEFNAKKKTKKPLELSLMTFGKPPQAMTQVVDSTGRFNFKIKDHYVDDLEILIQSKMKEKKKNVTINLDYKEPPKITYDKTEHLQLADSTNLYLQKNIERKRKEENYEVSSGTIELDEVELSGYKLTPEREKMMQLHGPPDVVIEDKELHSKVKKWSYGLFSVLMFSYPDDIRVSRVGPNGGFLVANAHGADFTFIIIDGIPVLFRDYHLIGNLPTEEIKSVEIIKSPKNPRKYEAQVFGCPMALDSFTTVSFINIYTYSKKGLYGVRRTPGISKFSIKGFSPKREFYTPKYDDMDAEDWNIPDLRSVVYWNPSITTDASGKAKVEFYNGDDIGEMLVIIEGICPNGKLGYYETNYQVRPSN